MLVDTLKDEAEEALRLARELTALDGIRIHPVWGDTDLVKEVRRQMQDLTMCRYLCPAGFIREAELLAEAGADAGWAVSLRPPH